MKKRVSQGRCVSDLSFGCKQQPVAAYSPVHPTIYHNQNNNRKHVTTLQS